MKKLTAFLLAVLMALVMLCGCKEKNDGVTRGAIVDGVYTNESIKLTFKKPSLWRFSLEEECTKVLELTDFLNKENTDKASSDLAVLDFMASNVINTVTLLIEDLKASDNEDMTVGEYAEITKKNLRKLATKGLLYTFGEDRQAHLGEEEFLMINAKNWLYSIKTEQFIYVKKVGYHMIKVTATTTNSLSAESFEKMFS